MYDTTTNTKVEQYSQDKRDLGILDLRPYADAMASIFQSLKPTIKPGAHCVINVPDMWWDNERITIHIAVIEALRSVGYEFRNTIIWDRTNIVNRIGIFGWPSNYITMGTTFETSCTSGGHRMTTPDPDLKKTISTAMQRIRQGRLPSSERIVRETFEELGYSGLSLPNEDARARFNDILHAAVATRSQY